MPALNFQAQFADAVESGEKCQTIRAYRKDKRDPKPGDTLFLFTGTRTKACRKLGEVQCIETETISIDDDYEVRVGNRRLDADEIELLAEADGFHLAIEFLGFFEETHGLPFEGLLIRWDRARGEQG